MGLFDLDEYQQKKARADESATPPRSFPVAFAEVNFNGRIQKLLFEPVLLDGGRVFISFRPEDASPDHALISGGYLNFVFQESNMSLGDVAMALTVETENAFTPESWLSIAIYAVEGNHFGRLKVVEEEGTLIYQFFGSTGTVYEQDYHEYADGSYHGMFDQQSIDYEPPLHYDYWATNNAIDVLLRLDAKEFAAYIDQEKSLDDSTYGLSLRWRDWSSEEKSRFLPPIEKEIDGEVTALMRALVWSEPLRNCFFFLDPAYTGGQIPSWKRPRFFVEPTLAVGKFYDVFERFERRIERLWPYVAEHFLPRLQAVPKAEVHPFVLQWMQYNGAYIIELSEPTAHEHLEARLLLRDFLAEKGVSLAGIDADLGRQEIERLKR